MEMKLTKKRIVSALLMVLLLFTFTACGDKGNDGADANNTQNTDGSSVMDKNTYLSEMDQLNSAAGEFTSACAEFMTLATSSSTEIDDLYDSVEKIRESKASFLEFNDINNPPEGYEDAHKQLAESSKNFGEFIDRYCDALKKTLDGEEVDTTEIEADLETLSLDLSNAMTAVKEIK